ncbi:MAG: zf-HC2 domain-containing protein [Blastocatellia bacterium]|nr:zf-HC2 domain-containing protein [Blastocatellia bacterium]
MSALEEELIDDYVRGNLSDYERQRFERHYLSTAPRRARVETARQLAHLCSQQSRTRTSTTIWNGLSSLQSYLRLLMKRPLTVATAFFLVLAVSLGIEVFRLQDRLSAANEEHANLLRRTEEAEVRLALTSRRPREEQTQGATQEKGNTGEKQAGKQERPQSQSATDRIVLLTVMPGSRDIKGEKKAVISSHTKFLQLHFDLEQQDREISGPYRAVVRNIDDDKEIWAQEGIRPRRGRTLQYLIIKVPADRFRTADSQDFMLTISVPAAGGGYEDIDSSNFRVLTTKP